MESITSELLCSTELHHVAEDAGSFQNKTRCLPPSPTVWKGDLRFTILSIALHTPNAKKITQLLGRYHGSTGGSSQILKVSLGIVEYGGSAHGKTITLHAIGIQSFQQTNFAGRQHATQEVNVSAKESKKGYIKISQIYYRPPPPQTNRK